MSKSNYAESHTAEVFKVKEPESKYTVDELQVITTGTTVYSKVQSEYEGSKTIKSSEKTLDNIIPEPKFFSSIDFEGTGFINPWKKIASYSSRIIRFNKERVVLEVVIDTEDEIVDEREFAMKLFEGLNIIPGSFFKVNIYERLREERLSITDGTGIVKSSDFPKVKFESFSDEDLFF